MADLNDFNYTDDVDDVLAIYVNRLLAATLRSEYKNVETLSADKTLADSDTPIQRLNCNGAARIVKMPTADAEENHVFYIVNSGTGYTITVKSNDESITHAVLIQGTGVLMVPDGNGEYYAVGEKGAGSNLLINGGFNFWQRITPTTATAMTDDVYNAPDRWYSLVQGAGATINRNAGIGKSQYSAKMIAGGTTNRYGIAQIIEAENSIPLRGQTVLAQCRIKPVNNAGSGTRDYRIAILEWTGTADAVTSELVADWTSSTFTTAGFFASTTKTLVGTAVVTATHDTETILSVSGTVSASCNNLIVFIWTEDVPTHASDYALIGEIGLYASGVLPVWKAENVADEEARCLRYYENVPNVDQGVIGFGQCYTTTAAFIYVEFTTKRAVPTLSVVNPTTDFYLSSAAGGNVAVTSFSATTRQAKNSALVFPNTASGLVAGNATMLYAQVSTAKITVVSEL